MIFRSAIAVTLCGLMSACAYSPADEVSSLEFPDLIPREILVGNPAVSMVRVSPTGKYVSWLAPVDTIMNIHIAPVDDLLSSRVITTSTVRDITSYFWAPNERDIYFFSDENGNEAFSPYAASVDSGETRSLYDVASNARAIPQGVTSRRPDELLIGVNDRDPQYFDLVRINTVTGETVEIIENPGYQSWIMDEDLVPRAGQRAADEGGTEIVTMNGDIITTAPAEDSLSTYGIGFSNDGQTFFMLDSRNRETTAVTAIDLDTKVLTVIAENPRVDIIDVERAPDTGEVLIVKTDYLKPEWRPIGDDLADELAWLSERLGSTAELMNWTEDRQQAVVYSDRSDQPGTYFLFDRDALTLTELFKTRPALADYDLAIMHPRVIESRDGLELVSYLTLPVGSDSNRDGVPDETVPLVLLVHGGPWERDSYGYNSTVQHLANRGYGVLTVNFRGSTGLGKSFRRAAVGEFGGKMHDDLLDAVDWAISEGVTDPDTVAIMGASYGGYAALVGASMTPDRFACAVDLVGPTNLIDLVESFPSYWGAYLEDTWYAYIGDPRVEADRAHMLSRSPITHAASVNIPIIVFQGATDPRVLKNQSDNFVATLKRIGTPVTYIVYPDEGHGFGRPANFESFYALTEQFLSGCLGGRAEPLGDILERSSAQIEEGANLISGVISE